MILVHVEVGRNISNVVVDCKNVIYKRVYSFLEKEMNVLFFGRIGQDFVLRNITCIVCGDSAIIYIGNSFITDDK